MWHVNNFSQTNIKCSMRSIPHWLYWITRNKFQPQIIYIAIGQLWVLTKQPRVSLLIWSAPSMTPNVNNRELASWSDLLLPWHPTYTTESEPLDLICSIHDTQRKQPRVSLLIWSAPSMTPNVKLLFTNYF